MSYDIISEKVPGFTRRLGDQIVQGSNNTIIILGTDRAKKGPAKLGDGLGHPTASGNGKGTGTIHLIAGRKDVDGNPDFSTDDSFMYLSMKTDVDDNLGLSSVEKSRSKIPAAVIKSDSVRFVYRKDLKICIHDGKNYIYMDDNKVTVKIGANIIQMDGKELKADVGMTKAKMDGKQIEFTNGTANVNMTAGVVKVNSPVFKIAGGCEMPWKTLFTAIDGALKGHGHMTAVGPTTPGTAAQISVPLMAALTAALTTWNTASTGG